MQVHMKGLKHMVGNRGGLEKLNNPFLKLMISWLDIEGATSLNISPHFPTLQNSIHEIETVTSTQFLETILTSWDHKCRTLGDIHAALRTTAGVATYINQQTSMATADAGSNFWRDDINMARLLGPAYQEILRLEGKPLPHDITHKDYSTIAAREAFRRAVLLFLAAVKIRWGARAYELPRHLDAFRQIARLPGVQWGAVPEMNLWAHVVAALLEEKDKKEDMMDSLSGEMEVERMWHIETIVGIMGTLGLERGREAVDAARGIVWVEDILGERAGVLEREIDMFLER
ncbi:uncharacterized protein BCR38DRAFT_448264 [Pseudomassariella vexata]|uniref:Uncharacterized protein n=1 Tax=Pseudomassariella vexata TaxID=1141098 RepID=A0A1Y2DHE2_9PEZI|nr:uncharacterized protein BCR38DRAFT_448264 [Pseudomassariella vexata]ORY58165.1 hypothetical protein BCR38DRAFT_448264 [Pseudomassariella vexata]